MLNYMMVAYICKSRIDKWIKKSGPAKQVRQDAILDKLSTGQFRLQYLFIMAPREVEVEVVAVEFPHIRDVEKLRIVSGLAEQERCAVHLHFRGGRRDGDFYAL